MRIKFDAREGLDDWRSFQQNGLFAADSPLTMQIREQDVKQVWQINMNGKRDAYPTMSDLAAETTVQFQYGAFPDATLLP